MLTSTACSTLKENPLPPGSGEGKPVVVITTACEDLAKRVPLPKLAKGDNAKVQLARHRGGLVSANSRIDATRDCQKKQRERFGGAHPAADELRGPVK